MFIDRWLHKCENDDYTKVWILEKVFYGLTAAPFLHTYATTHDIWYDHRSKQKPASVIPYFSGPCLTKLDSWELTVFSQL